jgi:hypothetical protein
MNHNFNNLTELTDYLKVNPVLSFIVGIFVLIATNGSNGVYSWALPQIVMQVGQCIAWAFVYCTGAITILGFLENKMGLKINWKFFKRKKKDGQDNS